jgi:hypothetical protein
MPDEILIDKDPTDDIGAADDPRAAFDDDPPDDAGAFDDPREMADAA